MTKVLTTGMGETGAGLPQARRVAGRCNIDATGACRVMSPGHVEEAQMEPAKRHDGRPVLLIGCAYRCGYAGRTQAHHDRLLAIADDPTAVLDLMELAVTWGELDYSGTDVIPPDLWSQFCERHVWRDPEQAMRIFALANDIAMHSRSRCSLLPQPCPHGA
ncbi:hypothetical protein [Pseudonocardia aurantiaca]|uniref:CGGC domain-containing protein n=1 Tax=Pseudonocardia aurantiaca TaxID=75290 RepID=A0ABW4FG35_9PSEU